MIVPMKKMTLVISARDHDAALYKLRDLGVVHISNVKAPESEELPKIEKKLAKVDRALLAVKGGDASSESIDAKAAEKIVDTIVSLSARKESLQGDLNEMKTKERWFNEWGAVSKASIDALRNAGIVIRFHVCTKKALKNISVDQTIVVLNQTKDTVHLVHFTDMSSPGLDLAEDPMPPIEIASLRRDMEKNRQSIDDIDTQLKSMAAESAKLVSYRKQLETQREFALAKYGMGEVESFVYLQGYCPVDDVEAVKRLSEREVWGYIVQDPDDPDETPTLVHNPKWLRIIRPVYAFMGTIPGYAEFDISFWFLLFFSLFYAMLVGDAGYGLVFLAATIAARIKLKNLPWEPFGLMFVLSGATIIWGTITGTWFGMAGILEWKPLAFLGAFVIEPISSINGSQDFMMLLCFFIGAVHLTIAHSLIAIRIIRTPNAVAQLGWIAVIWSLFFVAQTLVLGRPSRPFVLPLLIAGFLAIGLFENYQKNAAIKGALSSLANLPLSVISAFSDVVSYLRLFAVGVATFIVAGSFNQMASELMGGVVGTAVAAMTIFLGHTINIVLAVMAVVVHGIRLNMLEFSGHLSMQWSGKAYRPFIKR
ncbi:MAG: hypothetical protein WBM02_12365 [bacterium]